MCVGYHWIKFIGSMFYHGFILAITGTVLFFLWEYDAPYVFTPVPMVILSAVLIWFVIFPVITQIVDYLYDHIMVTNNRIVIIDQSSIFTRDIRKMDLENIASVRIKTQWLNLFPFGTLIFDLKEGVGKSLTLKYIPKVDEVASCISCMLRDYQTKIDSPQPSNV